MRVQGYTHVALDLASPSRMERYLRETFGLQTLRRGWKRGDYVRIIGSPYHQKKNPGFLELHVRQSLPQGRLDHIALGIQDYSAREATAALQERGFYVDEDNDLMIYGPEDLYIQIDSFIDPMQEDRDDSTILMEEMEIDPDLPCLVRGIHHVALDVSVPTRMLDWLGDLFDAKGKRRWARKGWYISKVYYPDGPKDPAGREPGLMPLFRQDGISRARLNHIAFDFPDADEAIHLLESRGVKVDLDGDAMIHGPEDIWYQIDSKDAPFGLGHEANDPGPRFTDSFTSPGG
jgi:catechol 2,3-dioxygenase-like lactoylglutathione lyase family enzyme